MDNLLPQLPQKFRDIVAGYPESSMGANRITAILADGQRIYDVYIGGDGEIAKVGTKLIHSIADLCFDPADIVGVKSET